jgi:hypothetical protein
MFMVKENIEQKERLEKIYRKVKAIYGAVPPQINFLGNIEADYLEDFLKIVLRVTKHPNIDPDLFGFMRLHIAFREEYAYCKKYNTQFLLAKGYRQEQLDAVVTDIMTVPFNAKHQALASHAVRVVYESKQITAEDFEALYALGWSQKDVFDAIDHATTLLKNGRILTAYSQK